MCCVKIFCNVTEKYKQMNNERYYMPVIFVNSNEVSYFTQQKTA